MVFLLHQLWYRLEEFQPYTGNILKPERTCLLSNIFDDLLFLSISWSFCNCNSNHWSETNYTTNLSNLLLCGLWKSCLHQCNESSPMYNVSKFSAFTHSPCSPGCFPHNQSLKINHKLWDEIKFSLTYQLVFAWLLSNNKRNR